MATCAVDSCTNEAPGGWTFCDPEHAHVQKILDELPSEHVTFADGPMAGKTEHTAYPLPKRWHYKLASPLTGGDAWLIYELVSDGPDGSCHYELSTLTPGVQHRDPS